jgi:hypothetical protein
MSIIIETYFCSVRSYFSPWLAFSNCSIINGVGSESIGIAFCALLLARERLLLVFGAVGFCALRFGIVIPDSGLARVCWIACRSYSAPDIRAFRQELQTELWLARRFDCRTCREFVLSSAHPQGIYIPRSLTSGLNIGESGYSTPP